MPLEVVISVISFATIWLLIITMTMRSEHTIAVERMRQLEASINAEQALELFPESVSFKDRVVRAFIHKIATSMARLMPGGPMPEMKAKLERAGNPYGLSPAEFVGLRALCLIAFSALGLVIFLYAVNLSFNIRVLSLAVFVVAGKMAPDFYLNSLIARRQTAIRKALPDTFDLLVVSAEAGLGFDSSLSRIVGKMRGPISEEFQKVMDEMRVGISRVDAIRHMANRVGIMEMSTFAAAIYQADVLGTGVSQVLRTQSESLRDQRNSKAREAAAKMPVKMLFPLVFFIFPATFVVIIGPGAIQILRLLGSMGQ